MRAGAAIRRFFAARKRAPFAAAIVAGQLLFLSAAADTAELRLATTTSVDNSGLLAVLLPDFERKCRCRVRTIIAGSGQALALGRRGDVDALLTHAPEDEARFVAAGFADSRRVVMQNSFVLVGPEDDPAELAQAPDIVAALQKLARGQARFVSRGDESGTHQKEKTLWAKAGAAPARERHIETGAGMGRTLLMADELRAYALSDRGTYLAFRDKTALREVSRRHPLLRNPYSAMAVSAARHPHVRGALARQFVDWLASSETQRRIGEYRYRGETLFFPAAER